MLRSKAILAAIFLSMSAQMQLCAAELPAVNTPSGKPEVTIDEATVSLVKSAIMNRALSRGWTVTGDTTNTLRIEKPANDNILTEMLLGSQANMVPNYRINFTFVQIDRATRVVADSMIVTNPGTGLEQYTSLDGTDAVRQTYFDLINVIPKDVAALRSKASR